MTTSPGLSSGNIRLSAAKRALLEQRLRRRSGGTWTAVQRRPAGSPPPPLSFAQERLWFMDQIAPGNAAYTIPLSLRLRGKLHEAALSRALSDVVARHESLRSRFTTTDDGRPQVEIAGTVSVPLRTVHLAAGITDAGEREQAAAELLSRQTARPFDLSRGPLLRAHLVPLSDDDHVLLLTVHHIISDGWSNALLADELLTIYDALCSKAPPALPELPVQYGDYALWQRDRLSGSALEADLQYWRTRLVGVPPLELPLDRPRASEQGFAGASHGFRIDQELTAALTRLGREHDATLYMTLLAAFQVLLSRYSGQRDFAIGSPVGGRLRHELESLIGLFINVLAIRAELSGDLRFHDLLTRTRDIAVDAYAHQEVPFEQLVNELHVDRDVSRSAVFQVVFSLQNYDEYQQGRRGGLIVTPFPVPARTTRFDLELHLKETQGALEGAFIYNRELFAADTIERMADHLRTLLRSIGATPGAKLARLELLPSAERVAVLERWNGTEQPIPDDTTLTRLIEAQVARTPEATAVVSVAGRLTFAELNARANRLAHHLRRRGVGPEDRVAVCAERSPELVAGLLAVLKAGAAYVPLDPDHPPERLAWTLADASAGILLTQRSLRAALPATGATTVLLLDDPDAYAGHPSTNPRAPVLPENAAYMIYTSGSTGRPKGVPNTHRGICNRLDWMQRTYGLASDDVVVQKTPIGFDVSVWEFFWPLLTGARLLLARPGGHKDPGYLRDLIVEHAVTTVHFVPSMLAAFLKEDGIEACTSLRRVICSGEELPTRPAVEFFLRLPDAELHNLYGPTEAAIDVSRWECRPGEIDLQRPVPIGRPVPNTRLYVLDPDLRPTPIGVPGELHIGGVQLARGYEGRPMLTADAFRPDPFGPAGTRLYKTGDLTRLRPDGAIDFLGRIDNQVKIRGMRIEPGEVESRLREHPGVRDAAVIARQDVAGDKHLVAYVVGDHAEIPAAVDLRQALRRVLPEYMIPATVVPLSALPLSPNGKLDRRALPAPERDRDAGDDLALPRTTAERAIADIWQDVLGVESVGIDDNFFDLGGHSLVAIQVVARMRRALASSSAPARAVGVMDLFKHPTVRELATRFQRQQADSSGRTLLYELTRPVAADRRRITYVCIPYGGGNPLIFQPLAEALPEGCSLYAMAIPGHDPGIPEERPKPIDDIAELCVREILDSIAGPLVLYGHCGIGGALAVEVARRLEAAGRELEAVYIGAIFPFARPRGRIAGPLARLTRYDRLRGDRVYQNRMTAMGTDTSGLEGEQIRFMVRNMRRDTLAAEEYFTGLLSEQVPAIRAPIISVVGERDPATDYYEERFKEWHFLTGSTALVILDEAGHYFIKYRAGELAEILTNAHVAIAHRSAHVLSERSRGPGAGWWLAEESRVDPGQHRAVGPEPSMRRFLLVACGQLISLTGTAVTDFAIPIWIYLTTGSLTSFALFITLAIMPGVVVAPLAGAIVDRSSRRRVMIAGNCGAGLTQLALGLLLWSGNLQIWHLYPLIACLSVALTFQRLGFTTALPQLVPKPYLGHANGVVQMVMGIAQFVAPLVAVALLATIGLGGILVLDVASFGCVLVVLLLMPFPATMAHVRRESLTAEIANGWRLLTRNRSFRAPMIFFGLLNIMLSALLLSVSPLVLSFDSLTTAGKISFAGGVGAALGGLVIALWGGPRQRRMRGVLGGTFLLGVFAVVTGLHASPLVVGLGAFGLWFSLSLVNGIYLTIIHVKFPQRFHGRVQAINQMIAWSTLPIGFGVVAPLAQRLFEPLMSPRGILAPTVGSVIGVGEGRGLAFMYVVLGLGIAVLALISARVPVLARFDDEVPDATPDDLVGAEAIRLRSRDRAGLSWTAPAFAKAITMPVTETGVAAVLGKTFPLVRIREIVLRTGGEISAVYEVRCSEPDQDFILKVYPDVFRERMRKEQSVYELLQRCPGVPTAAVVLGDDSLVDLPYAYLVMTKVDGRPLAEVATDLSDAEMADVYRQMGRILRGMHGVPMRTFGLIDGAGAAPHPSNESCLVPQFAEKLRDFIELGGDPALHRAMSDFVAVRRDLLGRCESAVLCHNDFQERNVLVTMVDGGPRVTGVIDMENAVAGDPLLDIARTDYFAVKGASVKRDGFLEGYGSLPVDWADRLALYRLYHMLDHWRWMASIGQSDVLPAIAEDIADGCGIAMSRR